MCDKSCGCGARIRRGRKWNQDTRPYSQNAYGIPKYEFVNALSVYNAGTVSIRFNREILPPQATKSVSMHEDDEYVGEIDLEFFLTGAPGEIPLAFITQVYYTEPPKY